MARERGRLENAFERAAANVLNPAAKCADKWDVVQAMDEDNKTGKRARHAAGSGPRAAFKTGYRSGEFFFSRHLRVRNRTSKTENWRLPA